MAILNLAVNARDAMPHSRHLRMEAGVTERRPATLPRHGRFARLAVVDSGTGMDEATLARAVDPFFSTKGVGRGMELGLSMVHGLASQLGGALALRSHPGEGTTVELWLPIADAPVPETPERGTALPKASAGVVLLVDDEDLVRASTARMLAELGYAVTGASSAEEALRRLEAGPAPDLVVTDHLMAGMMWTELARILRQEAGSPRILLISGYTKDAGIRFDLPRLTKPFRQAEVAAALAGLGP
jgi:CheY-like chemotaxis protein